MRFLLHTMSKLNLGLTLIMFVVIFSCKKKDENSVLGLDIQPEDDLVGVTITDSVSLFMHTQKVDSTISSMDQYKFLGSVLDPVFGRTDVGIYTNISIANSLTNLSFGTNPVLDSAELVMRFMGSYLGDTTTALTYDIYLLNEKIQPGVFYYTNQHISHSFTKVSSVQSKLVVRGGYLCLVLPLDKNLAQSILQTTSNLVNNTAFQNANKGFYITTSNTNNLFPGKEGAIYEFDLDDDLSGMNLYYKDGTSASAKSKIAQFTFRGPDALRYNHIKHNYIAGATQNLYSQITGDTIKGNNSVHLNSFGGTRVKVYLPYLKNFTDSQNVAISRAELILKVDETTFNSKYGYPANLALIACSQSGTEELVYDQLENSDFVKYNGKYDAVNKQYVFNIARQIQKIITNKIGYYGFYLVNADPDRRFVIRRDNRLNRVVFGGKTNTLYPPKFKVTYIKYPKDK